MILRRRRDSRVPVRRSVAHRQQRRPRKRRQGRERGRREKNIRSRIKELTARRGPFYTTRTFFLNLRFIMRHSLFHTSETLYASGSFGYGLFFYFYGFGQPVVME